MAYEQLDLIEEVTRNDGSKYYEISNIDQNGIAELAVDRGLIKKVRILQLNLARTKALQLYEEYMRMIGKIRSGLSGKNLKEKF